MTKLMLEGLTRDPSKAFDNPHSQRNLKPHAVVRQKRRGESSWIDIKEESQKPRSSGKLLNLIKSCRKEKNLLKARSIHADVLNKGLIAKDVCVATALIATYAKCGALREARELFEQLPVRDVVSWSALIGGYAQNGLGREALKCFQEMQDMGVCPNAVTYVCILKACGIVGCLEIGEQIDAEVRKQRLLEKDFVLGTALVDMYSKCGALEKAREVFEHLPVQDIVSWNALITGYAQHGLGDVALKCFSQMKDVGVCPDAVTYICLLKACATVGSLKIGEDIDAEIRKQGLLHKDIVLGNALIDMYSKCGALEKAREVFENLPMRDTVSWNSLIAGYVRNGFGDEVLKCFESMQIKGIYPDAVTYVYILKACGIVGCLEIGESIEAKVRKQGLLKNDIVLGNAVVDMYCKCGSLEKARETFEQLTEQNIVSWNALIAGYAQNGHGDEALKYFKRMQNEGICPDTITYVCSLKACGLVGCLEIGKDIEACVRKQGLLKKDVVIGTALVDMYFKCGSFEKGREIFEQLSERNVVSWSAIIAGYAENGLGDEALKCFRQMHDEGVCPNTVTYISVLKACGIVGCLEIGEDIGTKVRKQGLLSKDVAIGNALVDMYSKCGVFEKAKEVLEEHPKRNVVTWNALMVGYAQHGLGDEALKCFRQMQNEDVYPDVVTYVCALKACGIVGSLEIGEHIDAEIRKQKLLEKDAMLGTALLDMYSKCGALGKAREVFEQLTERNILSWSALIAGYGQLGQASVAFNVYTRMRTEKVLPNLVTFIVLLNACSHAGLLEEGERLFGEMCVVYCLTPTLEHYTCMVDLFGRAGCFDTVNALLDKVPHSGHLPLLQSILSSCNKWRNVKLGRWAFEQLVQLDEKCAAAYVCMGNIYAGAGIQRQVEY